MTPPPGLHRLYRDRRGTAAVEFALIVPMILFLLFGAVELTNALNTQRRVENTAASLADVISRDTVVTNQEVADMWAAMTPLMFPTSADEMRMRVTSVRIESPTQARVVWSEGRGMGPRSAGSTLPATMLADGMMVTGTSLIMAEAEFSYQPVLPFVFGEGGLSQVVNDDAVARGPFEIRKTAYRRSRLVDPITRSN